MSEETIYEGRCHCGAIEFEYHYSEATKPLFNAFCHCSLCRRVNSASGVHLLGVPPPSFKITKGEDLLGSYDPTPNTFRKWCTLCGTGVCQGPKGAPFLATYPSTYDAVSGKAPHPVPAIFQTQMHCNMENSNLPKLYLLDRLPAFKDFPAPMGGSGNMFSLPDVHQVGSWTICTTVTVPKEREAWVTQLFKDHAEFVKAHHTKDNLIEYQIASGPVHEDETNPASPETGSVRFFLQEIYASREHILNHWGIASENFARLGDLVVLLKEGDAKTLHFGQVQHLI